MPLLFCGLYLLKWLSLGVTTVLSQTSADQASPAQVVASPSMEETVAFLRETYGHQQPQAVQYGSLQGFLYQTVSSIEQPKPCHLEFFTQNHESNPETNWVQRSVLDLTHSDPLSLFVVPYEKGHPGESRVKIRNAIQIRSWVAPEPDTAVPVQPHPMGVGGDDGFVLSVAPEGIVVVNISRRRFLLSSSALQFAILSRDGQPATFGMVHAGDSFSYGKRTKKAQPEFAFASAPSNSLPERFSEFEAPFSPDEETANRVARALIHAMALCHENQKPSPF